MIELARNVDALLSGDRWAVGSLTYSFPDSALDYSYRGLNQVRDSFRPVTAEHAAAARAVLNMYQDFSGLRFNELSGTQDRAAVLMFGRSADAGTAFSYFPFRGDEGGDMWFNLADFNNPVAGSYAWATIAHEIGHALGLKHGHETDGGGALEAAVDSHEYSLMTYRSYVGAPPDDYVNGPWSGPQTPMMLDIAAIQHLYGANFSARSGDDVYSFTPNSGRMKINGAPQEQTGDNIILRTIWDGGGNDTYDLSAYWRGLAIDLAPGGFVDLDAGGNGQHALLGEGKWARGHVFNALQHEGNARSLIENAIGGAAADTIVGNQADNRLEGRGGADTLEGLSGDDTLVGGGGGDLFVFDFRDLADRDVDLVLDLDFAAGDRIAFLGFGAGTFHDGLRAGNAVQITGGGDGVLIDSLGDLSEISVSGRIGLAATAGSTVSALLWGGGRQAEIIFASLSAGGLEGVSALSASAPPVASSDDRLVAGRAPARLSGGEGNDTLIGGAAADVLRGGADDDRIAGRVGDDLLRGGRGADRLFGQAGDDTVNGGGGRDIAHGGGGGDLLLGGRGADALFGDSGADTVRGGTGADRLDGGSGADRLFGGGGPDRFFFARGDGRDTIV
ncbi:MAG: M10 family metallopeptidase, partial [Paracoccaceae bacterium]